MSKYKTIIVAVCNIFLITLLILFTIVEYNKNNNIIEKSIQTNIPSVESIQKQNDSILIDVEKLDSIKNVEIIKIKTLSNDSTIELFYSLIKSE